MSEMQRRELKDLAQFNLGIPRQLKEDAQEILRRQRISLTAWVVAGLHDVIKDYHERKAWEARQQAREAQRQGAVAAE